MAEKSKGKDSAEQEIITLDGGEGQEPLVGDVPEVPITPGPKIIQNYYFQDELLGAPIGDLASSEPVGPAGDQCYRFEIVNNAIDLTWNATIATDRANCVFLSSAVIEKENRKPGKATFIICCEKQDDGKCKTCATIVTLTVSKKRQSVTKKVKVFCRAN